jgi:hypothetical protein
MGEIDLKASDSTSTFNSIDKLKVSSGSHSNKNMWIDEFYVRKWVETKPGRGSWGAEESL